MKAGTVHILIVEDSATHAALIRSALESEPGRTLPTFVSSLAEARERLAEEPPGLIIADYLLPDGKGTDLLPSDPEEALWPVIVMTSHGDERIAAEAMKAGALDYVPKSPTTLADMPRIIDRVLRQWEHIIGRRQAEAALRERAELAMLSAEIGAAFTEEGELKKALQRCTDALVRHLGAAFARIWIYNDPEEVLDLKASSGDYTRTDGYRSHIPLGDQKVGIIAQRRQPHLTNEVLGDPEIGNQPWVIAEKMVAFAGYPLVLEEKLVGVVALFSRKPMTEAVIDTLASIANELSLGIEHLLSGEALVRANRSLKALSACNAMLVRAETEEELLAEICRIIVEIGGYRLAWVAYVAEDEEKWIRPAARYGQGGECIELPVFSWADNEKGQTSPERAIRGGKPALCRDIAADPAYENLRECVLHHGFRSTVALPLSSKTQTFGALSICAAAPDAFSEDEIDLLSELAGNLTYGILALRDGIRRQKADERLKEAFAEAQEGKDKIDAILESIVDGILVTDKENRVILMNPSAEDLLGASAEKVHSLSIDEVVREEFPCRQIAATADNERPGEPVDWELPPRPGEDERTVQIRTSVARRRRGESFGTITILRDVTSERQIERMKNEFISTAAHELRTPLTSVLGYADLLLNKEEFGIGEAQQMEFLSYISEKAENLAGIIDDLLDLSRLQAGRKIPLDRKPCDIGGLIEKVVSPYRTMAIGHRCEVSLENCPAEISVDSGRIEQVLENLLSNAVKYSPEGGSIRIVGKRDGDSFRISVTDEGIGIAPELVEKVFDYFYRVDSSNTAIGGLGLGMAIARNIVEAHEGSIWVESSLGRGATIAFTLPLSAPADAEGA